MKYSISLLLLLLLFSNSLLSKTESDHVSCHLKIYGNEVPCSVLNMVSGCPISNLEESKYHLTFEIHESEKKSEIIKLKKVIIDPGGPLEKNYNIFMFSNDKREEDLKTNQKVDLISFDLETKVKFDAKKDEFGTYIDFQFMNTKKRAFELFLPGESNVERFLSIDNIGIKLSCEIINMAINQDLTNGKKSLEKSLDKSNLKSVISQ